MKTDKFSKLLLYNKFRHRILFYVFWGPVTALILGVILFFVISLFEVISNFIWQPKSDFILNDYSFIIVIPVAIVSFLYAYIFFEIDLKAKITYGIILGINYIFISGLFNYFYYNIFGIIIISIILFEISYNIFNQRDYRLLIPLVLIFIVWFFKFRVGNLPNDLVKEDFKRIIKTKSIHYVNCFTLGKYKPGNDDSINYIILTQKDTLILEMNYKKEFEGALVFGSQKWKLKHWKLHKY
jgi:hypothetical protein